jgi:hypothetical protein
VAAASEEVFRAAVVGRMVEETRQPNGTYFVALRRINVLALK